MKLRNLVAVCAVLGLSMVAYAEDKAATTEQQPAAASTEQTTTTTTTTATTAATPAADMININTADEAALAKVKGIGKAKAKEIVDYRTKNGDFKSTDDLLKIKFKGKCNNHKWFEKIKDKVTV